MATESYKRIPEGFRFQFDGIKTNASADAIPPTKYPYAQNIRGRNDKSVRTRPGGVFKFSTGANPDTDIRAYDTLGTDNKPRYLTRDTGDLIWLDNGVQVGSLLSSSSPGAALIPFRPNNSPNPWMYIANGADYQKFSAPNSANAIIQQKVGIAEPQTPPDAAPANQFQSIFTSSPSFAHAGTATAASLGNRLTDTVGNLFTDPAGNATYTSFIVGAANVYQRGMVILINGDQFPVMDVFSPLSNPISIAAIYYYAGTTGRCVVVPQNLGASPGTEGTSINTQAILSAMRRGAILAFSGGGEETCLILDVTLGPDGTICLEVVTVNNHTAAETIVTAPAIAVVGIPTAGSTITSPDQSFTLSAGTGTQTSTLFTGAFFTNSGFSFQPDDYFHFSMFLDNLLNLVEMQVLIDVGDGSFTENFYYYAVRPADILAALASVSSPPTATQLAVAQTLTQRQQITQEVSSEEGGPSVTNAGGQTSPGSNQWSEIFFPLSAFIRVGGDQSKSLQNANSIQFFFQTVTGNLDVGINSITLCGGFQPDVGDVGAPYVYRVRPRSSLTGARGNPSPAMRYGVNPRRQQVIVNLPSAAYDPQIDTWDIERYGGSVTSWRYIGQTASFNTQFVDNFSDDAANGGDALDFDNFEPWPTIDLPLSVNVGNAIVKGTTAVLSIPQPNNVLRWLPGTLVQVGGINVYTLWTRPTLISSSGAFGVYLFQFQENAGFQPGAPLLIQEPILANQPLPYMWGPDASGTVFACGDPLRPGTLYFSKNFAPDSAPDTNNQEIVQPAEPLMGGIVIEIGRAHV